MVQQFLFYLIYKSVNIKKKYTAKKYFDKYSNREHNDSFYDFFNAKAFLSLKT